MKLTNGLYLLILAGFILFAGCTQSYSSSTPTPVATIAVPTAPPVGPTAVAATPQATSTPTVSAASAPVSMDIQGFKFSKPALTVAVGTKVSWINRDSVSHTVTSTSAPSGQEFDSGGMGTGTSFSKVFDVPGTYEYHCTYHPSMTATIIVQ